MPAVTIALPVYNGAEYIDEALAALSAQEGADIEIIVSDNASTDTTPEIVRRWAEKDSRIRFYQKEKNIGALPNFWWVLEQARAPLLMFAAHDDLWSPGYVSRLRAALGAAPGALLAAPRLVTIDKAGRADIARAAPLRPVPGRVVQQINQNLGAAHSGWYYGLFDRAALIEAIRKAGRFPHVWAVDFVLLLPFILSHAVTGDDSAVYYKRVTPLSDERYRPKTAGAQWRLTVDFWKACLQVVSDAPLSALQKIAIMPALFCYARHGGKFLRPLKLLFKRRAA